MQLKKEKKETSILSKVMTGDFDDDSGKHGIGHHNKPDQHYRHQPA